MSILADLRIQYHRELLQSILGYRPDKQGKRTKYFSIADSNSVVSNYLSEALVTSLEKSTGVKACVAGDGQTSGNKFETATKDFLQRAFERLRHVKSGEYVFQARPAAAAVSEFDQYEHLKTLKKAFESHDDLRALMQDYVIVPDITISREPILDSHINQKENLLDVKEPFARHTPLRAANQGKRILHASVSCKWTMRSDRSQNTRTEALNLIRNRTGGTPRIVVVTFEPMPTRLASIAMGNGDIDCTYHAALYELQEALRGRSSTKKVQDEMLETLIVGRRLRDISDLPFDLAI